MSVSKSRRSLAVVSFWKCCGLLPRGGGGGENQSKKRKDLRRSLLCHARAVFWLVPMMSRLARVSIPMAEAESDRMLPHL